MAEHANMSVDLGTGTPDGQLDFESDKSSNSHASTFEAITIALLYEQLNERISTEGFDQLNNEIEIPLIQVLAEMEHSGIQVDLKRLEALRINWKMKQLQEGENS